MSPFGDILAWHREFNRWSDVVAVISLDGPVEDYHRESAVGTVALRVAATGVIVAARVDCALAFSQSAGQPLIAFKVGPNNVGVIAHDVEGIVLDIVREVRKAPAVPRGRYPRQPR